MKTLFVDNTLINKDKKSTYLSADATTANSSLAVQSIVGIAVNDLLLIGEIGQEKTELAKVHSSTSPTGTTATLTGVLTFDHPQDTKVYLIDFDNLEVSHATTTGGTKTTLTTLQLQVDNFDSSTARKETQYIDTSKTSGFYFARMYDSVQGTSFASDWTDAVPYAGYGDNSVFQIKMRALNSQSESISDQISHDFLDECLRQARREYHDSPGKRPFRRKFNTDIGDVTTGMHKIEVPSDLENPYTTENIYGVRIGTEQPLTYYDKKDWDDDYRDIPHSTLATDYTVNDTWLDLTNARDFAVSGAVNIEGEEISYSARNITTGSLTISTQGASNHSAGKDVWQNESLGLPDKFTVAMDSDGSTYIYFNRPIESAYLNQNIYSDYYRTLTALDSDADLLDEPSYDMYVPYLSFRIKQKKNQGIEPLSDPDFLLWRDAKQKALDKEYIGQDVKFIPDIGHLI